MAAILVIDDEPLIRELLRDLLFEGHLCHIAETVEQALAWLDKEAYDVVLTDISLPGRSGLELLGLIRLRQPETPIIVISDIGDRAYTQRLIEMGAFDLIVKPFQMADLESSVHRAIEYHQNLKSSESEKLPRLIIEGFGRTPGMEFRLLPNGKITYRHLINKKGKYPGFDSSWRVMSDRERDERIQMGGRVAEWLKSLEQINKQ
jgi:DNA-binding NtrC family response regulator